MARRPEVPATGAGLAPLWTRGVGGVAAGLVAVELLLSARYGFHRDELYFLACARHLAWGYVDQPPFVPAVAWLATHTLGTSAAALRVLPALASGATVVLAALMARELGGRRRAQLVAALATATSPQVMAAFHLLSTAAFDMFFWAAITFVVLRLLRIGDQRLWIVIGAVSGLGLLNKLNVLFLLIGIGAGLVFAGRGRELLNRYVVAGAVIAAAIWLPNIVWNAQHDWAALSMLHSLHAENSTLGASIAFIPSQLVVAGIVQAFIWIAGLRFLLRSTFARPLALGFVVVLALFTIGGAKPYYLAGMYFVLLAAGGVSVEHQLEQSVPAARVRGVVAWLLVGAVIALPFTEPVIPQHSMPSSASLGNINKDLSATVGWQAFVGQIASVARTLPAGERSTLVVFTGDYGAAGAVDLWGERYGLRDAISGHNSYWWWGPGRARDGATTIAVDLPRSYLRTIFSDVTPAGVVATPDGIWSEERGAPIWICRGQNTPWAQAWPAARHYG